MTTSEAAELLLYIAGGWPNQETSEMADRFWARQLREVSLDDAIAAVDSLVADGQVHYPRPAEILSRCPQPWPNGKRYARYAELRLRMQGEWDHERRGYRCDGQLSQAERREFAELTRKLGVVA